MYYNRLGSDLEISWPIDVEDVEDISTLDLTLYVICNNFKKEMAFDVEDNTLLFTFYGIDQRVAGVYDLELVLNEGEHGQVICDEKNSFTLYK